MASVKGSKQYRMKVVPHRPVYGVVLSLTVVVLIAAATGLAYFYGHQDGLSLRAQVVEERNELQRQLITSLTLIDSMRQEIADLALGREIDTKATEEVRTTVEELEGQVASLNEEIRFYKGVMLPNVDDKGLRIERMDLNYTNDPNRVQYNLLLTQVVDKHELIQGTVEISLHGLQGEEARELKLAEIADQKGGPINFRFRYFQNIDGELNLPPEFIPQEVLVIAEARGATRGKLERKFPWQLNEG